MLAGDALEGSRITQAHLRMPHVEIAAAQELGVIVDLVRRLGDPTRLGLDTGLDFHFATYGVWGLALVSSALGREAVQLALRSLPLTHAFTTITYTEASDQGGTDLR